MSCGFRAVTASFCVKGPSRTFRSGVRNKEVGKDVFFSRPLTALAIRDGCDNCAGCSCRIVADSCQVFLVRSSLANRSEYRLQFVVRQGQIAGEISAAWMHKDGDDSSIIASHLIP